MSQYKRKFDGPTVQERRKTDDDKRHLSPHKKPKVWTLTVEWTETSTWRREKSFSSKASRDEARRRIEKHFKAEAEKQKRQAPRYYRSFSYYNSPFADFSDQKVVEIKGGPMYAETYEDAPPVNATGDRP